MLVRWIQFGEWDDEERPRRDLGIRDLQPCFVEDCGIVENDVEIDRSGAVRIGGISHAFEVVFNPEKFLLQIIGRECRPQLDGRVAEVWLMSEPHRLRLPHRGTSDDLAETFDPCHCTGKVLLWIDIRAKTDPGEMRFGHTGAVLGQLLKGFQDAGIQNECDVVVSGDISDISKAKC